MINLTDKVVCGRTTHNHNKLEPPCGHRHQLLKDGISVLNQHLLEAGKSGCVGHSGASIKCSVGLRSTIQGVHSILSNPKYWTEKPSSVGVSIDIVVLDCIPKTL